MARDKIRVFLTDDHAMMRLGLAEAPRWFRRRRGGDEDVLTSPPGGEGSDRWGVGRAKSSVDSLHPPIGHIGELLALRLDVRTQDDEGASSQAGRVRLCGQLDSRTRRSPPSHDVPSAQSDVVWSWLVRTRTNFR